MDRRKFLRTAATAAAALQIGEYAQAESSLVKPARADAKRSIDTGLSAETPEIDGHTLICEFTVDAAKWKVYEDLRTRDGAITFVSARKHRVLPKSAEAAFADAAVPYLGLKLSDIGMADADLLAERLLQGGGDPDPEQVRAAAPPQGSLESKEPSWRLPWDTFVGTKECFDTMPVFGAGSTRTYHPVQYFPEDNQKASSKRFDGLLGGWMPAVRKVLPVSDGVYDEVIVFGDVEATDKFIVQTWHRTARFEAGKISKAVYGHSYTSYPPARVDPKPEEFYRALLVFAGYWDNLLRDFAPSKLPQNVWVDMSKHAFAKELMVRPGGVYPKYGAVDRDYYGSEYDGFQDIFTSAVYANLEWGRLDQARSIIDNYFCDFVDAKGVINMRGPETAQFGMTLSLLARYFNYSGDSNLLRKHREKIEAIAALLLAMHDESLKLPQDDPGYGLIHGWSESDSCLMAEPMIWWLPYFANNAFTARGLTDISRVWTKINWAKINGTKINGSAGQAEETARTWHKRSETLRQTMVASMEKNVRGDLKPPYIGTYAGAKGMFREAIKSERPSPQGWPHRPYSELLQADVLPAEMANLVIDCMRAYGATTLGVVANVEPPHPEGRDILGFISYGYAQMLLRLDRVEEFLLFLYSHRFHDHTRGSWTAGEVAGIDGDKALFCIPAQLTIPLLVRWMLVLEDSDDDKLYLGKGLPREWVGSGKEIKIDGAPTRWGKLSFTMRAQPASKRIISTVELERAGALKEIQIKVRLPKGNTLQGPTANGQPAKLGGPQNDTILISPGASQRFEIVANYA